MNRGARRGALVVALAALAGCQGGTPAQRAGDVAAATSARIAAFRGEGRYRDALHAAREREARLEASPGMAAWRRQDAAREVATLERILTLADTARRDLADADRAFARAESLQAAESGAAAIELASRALELRRRWLGPRHPEVAASISLLARAEFSQGDLARARALDERALVLRRGILGEQHPDVAESASQLGRDLKTAGAQRDASLALYRRALDIRTRCFGPDSPEVASSLMDIANLHRAMFRRKQALPDFERALAIRRMHYGSHSEEVASTLTAMALTHTAAGDWRAAEPLVREALTIRRSLGATPREGLMISIGTYGMVLRHLGRYAEAESMMVEAIAMQEARRRMARPGSGRVGMFPLAMYWELAATRLEQGHGTEAWLAAERALGRVLLEAAIARGEVPAADPWEDLLARLQRSLPDSAAVVGWIDLRGGAGDSEYPFWCYAIRHTGPIFWQRVDRPPGKSDPSFDLTVRRATSELRAAAGWPLRVSDASELGRITLAIYRIRIEPLEPALRGVRTLHIVAPDVMYAVPIDAVADTTGRLLGDRFDISYAPSALLYVLAHERHPVAEARHGWRGLLVGSPEPTGGHPTLPRLEAAGEEVRALAGLLDRPTVLLGADATESRLAELARAHRLASFDLIHLATHADVDEFWPGRSAFLLADYRREAESQETIALDGRLTSDEIAASWSLDARLVSLAACRSLWGSRSRTEGFVGLNQSFLQAGAHTLLVSLWQVDDRATALLLGRFYRDALAPRGPRMPLSAALREAKAWLRAWQAPDGSRPYQHPVYWSGLVLLGTTD